MNLTSHNCNFLSVIALGRTLPCRNLCFPRQLTKEKNRKWKKNRNRKTKLVCTNQKSITFVNEGESSPAVINLVELLLQSYQLCGVQIFTQFVLAGIFLNSFKLHGKNQAILFLT